MIMIKLYTFINTLITEAFGTRIQLKPVLILFALCLGGTTLFADDCEEKKGCVTFRYDGRTDKGNGKTEYCVTVTNHGHKSLRYVAIKTPRKAVFPKNCSWYCSPNGRWYYVSTYHDYIVFYPYYCGIRYGRSDQFCFQLPSSYDDSYKDLYIQAKVGWNRHTVKIDREKCDNPCVNVPVEGGGAAGVVGRNTNFPASDATVCAEEPFTIENVVAPSGGSGELEVVWIKCSGGDDSQACTSRFEELIPLNVGEIYNDYVAHGGSRHIDGTCWEFIFDGDDDDLSLHVDGVDSKSCFLRCVRRKGCVKFTGEGNIITVTPEDCSINPRRSAPVEFVDEDRIKLSPNPAYDQFSITFDQDLMGQAGQVSVFNSFGQLIRQQELVANGNGIITLDVANVQAGLYTVYVNLEGRRAISKKLVIGRE